MEATELWRRNAEVSGKRLARFNAERWVSARLVIAIDVYKHSFGWSFRFHVKS
jgi:hypothetical protein